MDRKDWQYVGWVGTAGLSFLAIHGRTNRQWTTAHTFFAAFSLAAVIAPWLRELHGE
jgi:hypothetical protein